MMVSTMIEEKKYLQNSSLIFLLVVSWVSWAACATNIRGQGLSF